MNANIVSSIGAVLAIAGSAAGTDYTTDDNNLSLFPFADLYDGTLESMASLSLTVPDSMIITDVDIIVDISHTWAGALVWKLQSPSGTVVDLVSRPGFDEPADDGTGCCGQSRDLVFGNIYEIDDAALISSEEMGGGLEDPIDSFVLHSSGFANEFGLTTLNGENSQGVWTLYIGDSDDSDTGILDGFTLQILPSPAVIAFLGVAGLAARRRRG